MNSSFFFLQHKCDTYFIEKDFRVLRAVLHVSFSDMVRISRVTRIVRMLLNRYGNVS